MFSYPSYAACEATADLSRSGFSRTAVRDYQGADWHRNIFWLKGKYFALIDEITAKKAGTYYVESNMSTCPTPTVRWVRFTPRSLSLLPDDGGFEVAYQDGNATRHYMLTTGASAMRSETRKAQDITKVIVRQVHKGVRLGAGGTLTFVNLLYGDRQGDRRDYQLRRLSPTEGLILQNGRPVAYFGTDQSDQTRALLPIEARMFLLTGEMLAIVDGTSAGRFHRSARPASREVNVAPGTARDILTRLAGVAGM